MLAASYSGLVPGLIIAGMAKEELSRGRKYFLVLKGVVIAAVCFLFMESIQPKLMLNILISVMAGALGIFIIGSLKHVNTNLFSYSFFAVAMYETRIENAAPMVAAMVFFYGFLVAAADYKKLERFSLPSEIIKLLSKNILFIIMGLVLLAAFRI